LKLIFKDPTHTDIQSSVKLSYDEYESTVSDTSGRERYGKVGFGYEINAEPIESSGDITSHARDVSRNDESGHY
jgi:hypothetical protein